VQIAHGFAAAETIMKKNRHQRRTEAAQAQKQPALKIFMNAERFRISDLILRGNSNAQIMAAIGGPALVLSAFASELYLKCLICIETGRLAHGHDLRVLFRQISEASRRNIERRWNAYVATPERQRIYAALKALEGTEISTSLDWSLRNGGDGFVALRYIHEGETGTKFLLGELPQILRDEILTSKPEWSQLGHGPMKPVPGFEEPSDPHAAP